MTLFNSYRAIVIGTSAGGTKLLRSIVEVLPENFAIPIIVVQHIAADSNGYWIESLNKLASITVKEADEKELINPKTMYIAPPNYHLLIEKDQTFSLTNSERVNFARPSVDVLFETAADAYKTTLIGIILTGNNNDGAAGLKSIKDKGGMTIVQAPETAEAPSMPKEAIKMTTPDYIISPDEIKDLLIEIHKSYKSQPL